MDLIGDINQRLERVDQETRKAALYLILSRSWMRSPRALHRWVHASAGAAFPFVRDGLHMAFVVTLQATYQQGSGLVTIPSLTKRLARPEVRSALAERRRVPLAQVEAEVGLAVRTFDRMQRLTSYRELKAFRDAAVAHHTHQPDRHQATMGPLNRLMVRSVHLVDQLALAVRGEETPTVPWARDIMAMGIAFWSAGMKAHVQDYQRSRTPPKPDDADDA
jgi:hypothetical protein